MKKIKITADAILAIIRGVFEDEDVNTLVDDPSAPEEWQGKTINEILNVEYFTFKHRPVSSYQIISEELEKRGETNYLAALNRSFCVCSLGDVERLYSKDIDQLAIKASLDYFMQPAKLKLLEYLVEDSNIATSGLRFDVMFGQEARKVTLFFGKPILNDIQSASPFGEAAFVSLSVTMMLYPNVYSYADYEVSIGYGDNEPEKIPLIGISIGSTMTQKNIPQINKQDVDNINLSKAVSFVLTFEGYNIPIINYLVFKALKTSENNCNEGFVLKLVRGNETFAYDVIIKEHLITINADTSNETHTLSLVRRANGTS